ncbi:unnamed protein product [Peronospora belbahrii]|uniref:DNA methylase adenine-specific domain-containing protein n=1 Tax=Peronospora belbahrii TaxID=622444 RepID=A0AAU9L7W8_9STRA|nr:unnamed protein product [Peronospora belbahrii]CAH0513856.1 unnamed protein product [Peronospora belbahrii]
MLELRGYNVERGHFLLAILHSSNDMKDSHWGHLLSQTFLPIIERDFVDFQKWDRLLHRSLSLASVYKRLPTKRLRKLSATTWLLGDDTSGWRLELQKSVSVCEKWLNAAFMQLSPSLQQEFLNDDLYTVAKRKRAAHRENIKYARDLQQFFTSVELVDLVVQRVLEHSVKKETVWLEPSCGDGRFLTALLRAEAQHVIGYEIDERLHSIADRNVRLSAIDVAGGVQVQVCLGNFLESRSCMPADKHVIVIGNPPFGARGKDGSDLVHAFYQHAAKEWRASVIAFIVPERCSRGKFIETTLQKLNDSQSDDGLFLSWKLNIQLSLNDYHFEFGIREKLKRVRQPSVLQLFIRQY